MRQDLVTIYAAADLMQAQQLRDQLAERGIESWLSNEALAGAAGELPLGWSSSPRVVVATEDGEKAREIAEAFDRQQVSRSQKARLSHDEEPVTEPIDDEAHLWPHCPVCGERRLAVCKICQTARTDFPLAYGGAAQDVAGVRRMMVVCPTCDEPFYPRYYKLCEHCGFEFEDGAEVPQPRSEQGVSAPIRGRVWAVLVGTLLAGLVIGVYLWWLFR